MKRRTASYFLPGVFALAVFGSFTARASGPASEIYLTVGGSLVGIQGTSVIFSVAQSPSGQNQSALAVSSTLRTVGRDSSNTGGEYSLTGTPTGATYAYPSVLGSDHVYDGTTDGSFNYAWDYDSGAAYKFNLDWTGGTVLFNLGTGSAFRRSITYDPSNNSLWIAGDGSTVTLISDYSLAGTLLSSFNIGQGFNGALALDPADGTLWLNVSGTSVILAQYARSAAGSFGATETALNTQNYGVFGSGGGEFRYTGSVVPEPTTWITMLGGLAILVCVQRFRRGA